MLHTSASLTINENYSPDVPLDMEDSLNRIVPEVSNTLKWKTLRCQGALTKRVAITWWQGRHYRHLDEGLDDMPGNCLYLNCG